jgi:hypothetical protein
MPWSPSYVPSSPRCAPSVMRGRAFAERLCTGRAQAGPCAYTAYDVVEMAAKHGSAHPARCLTLTTQLWFSLASRDWTVFSYGNFG